MIYLEDNFMAKRQMNLAKHEWSLDDEGFEAKKLELEEEALERIRAKVNFDKIKGRVPLLRTLVRSYVIYELFSGSQYQEYAEGRIEGFYATLGDIKEEQESAGISPIESEDGSIPTKSRFI